MPWPTHEEVLKCSNCERDVHTPCVDNVAVKNKDKNTSLPLERPAEGVLFCTKSCWQKLCKEHDTSTLGWNNDGKNGRKDPRHSERIIIEAMCGGMCGGSWYDDYRSGRHGKNKQQYCEDLQHILAGEGVKIYRTKKSIQNKIEWVESKWRAAHMWKGNTGVGVRETHGEQRFNDIMRESEKFIYYYELEDIMIGRAGMVPKVTSDDMDDDESSFFKTAKDDECNGDYLPEDYVPAGQEMYKCNCGEDRAGCGVCGAGWGSKFDKLLKSGAAVMAANNTIWVTRSLSAEDPPSSSSGQKEQAPQRSKKRSADEQAPPAKSPSKDGVRKNLASAFENPKVSSVKSSRKASKKAESESSKKSRKNKDSATATGQLLSQFVALKVERMKEKQQKKSSSVVSEGVMKKVALAKKFKEMVIALDGNRLMAAQICHEFKIFLTAEELKDVEKEDSE